MKRFTFGVCAAVFVICMLASLPAAAVQDVAAARAAVAKYENAVVPVLITIKMTMSYGGESEKNERDSEAIGTVIDPSGLTVISLYDVDPQDAMGSFFDDEEMTMTSEVSDLKIRLADGKEVPAKVVLRDKDLGVAIIRPVQKPSTPWMAVNLKDSANVLLMDEVMTIGRLRKVGNRATCVRLERVQSIIEKPRKLYSFGPIGETGELVVAMDGKVVGVSLIRMMGSTGGGRGSFMDRAMLVVMPAEDLAAIAAQAPEDAPKEEKPAAEPKK